MAVTVRGRRSGSLAFVSGVLHLAKVLARDPRVYVEVWHKERLVRVCGCLAQGEVGACVWRSGTRGG